MKIILLYVLLTIHINTKYIQQGQSKLIHHNLIALNDNKLTMQMVKIIVELISMWTNITYKLMNCPHRVL